MAYSMDLRQRVVAAYKKEKNYAKVGRDFSVAAGTVRNWVEDIEPCAVETRGRPPALDEDDLQRLEQLALRHLDASEVELAAMLAPEGQKPLHRSIINRALHKMDMSVKKRRGAPASKTEKTSRTREESG